MKRQLLTLSAAFVAFFGFSQSNPEPFDLSTGAYTFTEWNANSPAATYPANMIFHEYTAEPGLASEPSGDWVCLYNIPSRARINGLGSNGIAFINTGDRQDSDTRCGNGSNRGYFVGDATVALNTTGRTNISVDFKTTLTTVAGGTREYGVRLQYRIGQTGAWSDLPSIVEFTTGGKSENDFDELSATLPSSTDNRPIVQVRFKYYQIGTGSGSRPQIALDEITIDSDEIIATPGVSASVTTLNPFTQTLGTPSAEQSFTVEGTDLTNDLTLTAPAEYEISLTSGSGFLSTLSITPTSGEISTTTIFVRLNASATGTHAGDITIESTGATTAEVAVSGQTNAIPTPEILASVTTLNPFTQTLGTPSAEQSFTVEGTDLTNDLTLTAPAEYEISLTSGSGFLSTLSITPTSGEVSTTTIFVRLNASATGTHSGDITIESTGATTAEVAVSGQTNAIPTPAISASTSSLTIFNQVLGTPSAEQSFTVEGTDLEEDITLTASAGYEVSLTSGSGFATSVVAAHTNGTVTTTIIYVRLNQTATGTHAGTITASSQNATDVIVNLDGETVAPAAPEITASTATISGFIQTLGTPSAEQSFTIEGTDLEEDITLTASAGYEVSLTSGSGFASSVVAAHTSGTVTTTTIYVRLDETTTGTHAGTITASSQNATDVIVNLDGETVAPTAPEITASTTTISGFAQTLGTPSAEQSFTIEGTDLEEDITLTASTGYEVSLTSGSGFASSVVATHTSGTVTTTIIYVRLNETAVGNHSGTVTASSQNATDVIVNLTGETTAETTPSELLYYWHFNNMSGGADVTEIIADYSYLTDFEGKFTYTDPITGERDIDRYSVGSSLNLQQGEAEGYSARVRNPSTTRSLIFDVPTTGAEGIGFKYAVQRSGSGMLNNIVQYSIDGINFISTDLVNDTLEVIGDEVWQLFTFDFASIPTVNNNSNFKIKITWLGNTTASNGNNRYDNITLTAESVTNVSVNPIEGLTKLNLYPNPFLETISISASGAIEKIQIVDMLGKTVQTITGNNNEVQQISTTGLVSGTYFFVVQTTEGTFQLKSVKK